MNTKFYILFVLLLSFSFANAQSAETNKEIKGTATISVSDDNKDLVNVVDTASTTSEENKKDILVDATKLKEVARSSDIRIYLNHLRNVENIKWLFPKINKAKTA